MDKQAFELVIGAHSKPFPHGPLATAIYINTISENSRISIKHDVNGSSSSTVILRKNECYIYSCFANQIVQLPYLDIC